MTDIADRKGLAIVHYKMEVLQSPAPFGFEKMGDLQPQQKPVKSGSEKIFEGGEDKTERKSNASRQEDCELF